MGAVAESNTSLILDGTTKQINKVLYVLCVSCTFFSGCCNTTSLQPLTTTKLQLKQFHLEVKKLKFPQGKISYNFPEEHSSLESHF